MQAPSHQQAGARVQQGEGGLAGWHWYVGVWFLTHWESQLQAGEAVRQYTARREENSQQERSIGSRRPVWLSQSVAAQSQLQGCATIRRIGKSRGLVVLARVRD